MLLFSQRDLFQISKSHELFLKWILVNAGSYLSSSGSLQLSVDVCSVVFPRDFPEKKPVSITFWHDTEISHRTVLTQWVQSLPVHSRGIPVTITA